MSTLAFEKDTEIGDMQTRICRSVAVTLALVALIPLRAAAQADCNDRLAELDQAVEGGKLDENQTSSITAIRRMASQFCAAGNGALANQMIDGAFDVLGQTQNVSKPPERSAPPSLPKTDLTIDYLAGEWCSRGTKNTQEVAPHVFARDGSYKIGIAAGNGFTLVDGGDSIETFRANYDRLISKEPDRFVVGDRGRYEYTFTRESCR
jgi:hypothetical protein